MDSVLGDRFPTIEDMKKLKYTTRVINEVGGHVLFFFCNIFSGFSVLYAFSVDKFFLVVSLKWILCGF